MSPIFTFIVIVLGLLAIANIIVGVANDAINFMNAAWGSRVARYRTILIVASAGILIGTLTSNGMMEVARSGVFYPENFTFSEVMMLFLGMMLGNVILFNIFNTLGLPTSTTVSMVFGLLGAALAVAAVVGRMHNPVRRDVVKHTSAVADFRDIHTAVRRHA